MLRPPSRTNLTVSALNSRVWFRRGRFTLLMEPLFYALLTDRGCPRNRGKTTRGHVLSEQHSFAEAGYPAFLANHLEDKAEVTERDRDRSDVHETRLRLRQLYNRLDGSAFDHLDRRYLDDRATV